VADKSPRQRGTGRRKPASTTAQTNPAGGDGDENGNGHSANSVINLASAAFAALTAAATLVVVPGSIALYFRLHNAGLPNDLGVVVSLPVQFLVAIGLTYVLFPLLVVIAVAVVVVLVPGDRNDQTKRGQTNSLLREPNRQGWDADRWSHWAVVAFLIGGTAALSVALVIPPPWWVVLISFVLITVCLIANIPIARSWRGNPDALPAVVLSTVIAGLIFTPWAIWFAVNRAHFPNATVCTVQGERFDGPFVGETSDRVYVGEPAIRILAIVPPRTASALRAQLPLDRYGVRFASSLTKRRLLTTDFAIVDLDLVKPGRATPPGIPVLAVFHKLNRKNRRAAQRVGLDHPLLQAKLDANPKALLGSFTATSHVQTKRPLTIASIPTSEVTRILIGARGSCPPARRNA
jgi:hypothetical protein